MVSTEYDLRFLQAGVEDLQAYLLSEVLYWPAGVSAPAGEPAYPQVTLGNLLLSRRRLQGRALERRAQGSYELCCEQMDALHQRWRSAWGRKAALSFHARLMQWQAFLSEYRSQEEEFAGRYSGEVRLRVLLALLQPEVEHLSATDQALLETLDKALRTIFIPGAFIWEPELAPSFPVGTFWFLYGSLKK